MGVARKADFNRGTAGWEVTAAEPGSARIGKMAGRHQFLGRCPGANEGNTFFLVKRSGKRPNRVSQDIVGLRTGRLHLLKVVVVDHLDLVEANSEKRRRNLEG